MLPQTWLAALNHTVATGDLDFPVHTPSEQYCSSFPYASFAGKQLRTDLSEKGTQQNFQHTASSRPLLGKQSLPQSQEQNVTNHVPVERCRHQAAGSFGSAGDKRLPSLTEVPLGHCLPAPEGQVPCYEYKMLFSSPHTSPHTHLL